MKWKLPPRIKVYEALGCIADKRIEINGNEAKVFSSSREKFYSVIYDGKRSIMCNDNGSYWKGYLGYPAIALLLEKGKIDYHSNFAVALQGIKWKEVNVKFKNDYEKTESYVLELAKSRGIDVSELKEEVERILSQINEMGLELLGKKARPPTGY